MDIVEHDLRSKSVFNIPQRSIIQFLKFVAGISKLCWQIVKEFYHNKMQFD